MPNPMRNDDGILVLALDTGSPLASVALARGSRLLAERAVPLGRSSERLLAMIEEVLTAAGVTAGDLGGVLALRGPGSFTGLRVGLATALGLHQALGVPATALSTLAVLAASAPASRDRSAGGAPQVVAAVDAWRDAWFVQRFTRAADPREPPRALTEPERMETARLPELAPAVLVGFGLGAAVPALGGIPGLEVVDPPPLAAIAAVAAATAGPPARWDAALLTAPLYLAPPAATPLGMIATAPPRGGRGGGGRSFRLRPAVVADEAALAALERLCFADPWSTGAIAGELALGGSLVRCAETSDAQLAGYAIWRLVAGEGELLRLAVDPAWRRRGLARALVGAGLGELAGRGVGRCHLEVRDDNRAAIALYQRFGFRAVGRRAGYYADGQDSVLFTREWP